VRSEDHQTDVEGLYAIGEASSGLHGANRLGGNSLIKLLVYGRIVGRAAMAHAAGLDAQRRSSDAVAAARAEIDDLLAAEGHENVRALQRAIRNTMTAHAGVVRSEEGLRAGLADLDQLGLQPGPPVDLQDPRLHRRPVAGGMGDQRLAGQVELLGRTPGAPVSAADAARAARGLRDLAERYAG